MYVVVQSLSHIWLCVSDCSPPGSSVHGLSQARILEWVGISFSRGSSWSRDRTRVSCIGKWILYYWATKEAHTYIHIYIYTHILFHIPFHYGVLSSIQLLSRIWLFARPPYPLPTPGVHPNPCPLNQWCHTTISSSVIPFSSCLQSFPVRVFSNELLQDIEYSSLYYTVGPSCLYI